MTTENDTDLGETIADLASSAGLTIAVAESLTSGAIASALGASPQAGDWFAGGVVAYSEHVKFDVLGVTPGPVITAACAEQMASGVGRLLSADLVAAVTGAGGPGSEEGKEAGTVFLAHGRPDAPQVEELHFDGDPEEVVRATVDAALAAMARDLEAQRR
ncbi:MULTISPECIES: CinA family protein [unclassified Leifsonia]|uniref:CinA family protein n=1 Tax=unclassified Leifsonia TaxID=2663824 RepID=UPI000365084F|nr:MULTISPECIES: CinA family protein [unclassified Leifsonia]TDP98410.1 nicotinamide-nucleotide amidase [Leifsonia sp. 115AMFTsu3.1]